MFWKDFSKKFREGDHAFLGASNHAWFNYDDEKLVKSFITKNLATKRGTKLHELACKCISLKVKLPDEKKTLNMYVNDSIDFNLRPEEKLYYSKYAFGTSDAINYKNGILRISDLKTGTTKVSFLQLKIYAALFFLAYPEVKMRTVKKIELRIYQNNEVLEEFPEIDEILHVMDRIKRCSKILENLEEEYDDGYMS